MSLSITNAALPLNTARSQLANVPQAVKDDVKALGKALRADDMAAARQAYVDLAKQAPEGATLQPGSPFATLGKALATGDVASAKTAFSNLVRGQIDAPATTDPVKPEPPVSLPPTVSSTGGSAGGTLSAVA